MKNIAEIFRENGIEIFGVCSLQSLKLLPCRKQIPSTGSAVVCLFPYRVKKMAPTVLSRFAAVKDYHQVIGEILGGVTDALEELFPDNEFISLADNSPVPEVYAAYRAGLGHIGRNGLLINDIYGSYCFIGEIVTDLVLEESVPANDSCGSCNACSHVCELDKTKCISRINQRQTLTKEEEQRVKESGHIWGCDDCQECCPKNVTAKLSTLPQFVETYNEKIAPGDSTRVYHWRKEAIIRNMDLLGN